MLRYCIQAALLALLVCCGPASALDPAVRLHDYNHVAWTTRDGAPGEIKCMAQTPDGWLWLGTTTGLFRFDGVRFERYKIPTRGTVAKHRITELRAGANGDLWMSFSVGGLSVLHADGKFEDLVALDAAPGFIQTLASDIDGSTWLATDKGMYVHAHGQLRKVAAEQGLPSSAARAVLLDQYQQLWALFDEGVYRLDRQRERFTLVSAQGGDTGLLQSPDGRLWISDSRQVTPLPQKLTLPPGVTRPLPRPAAFNSVESRYLAQFDRDGNLWTRGCPDNLCVIANAAQRGDTPLIAARDATDQLVPPLTLSSRATNAVLEDMEGNLWIATQAGLDRFRENYLIQERLPQIGGTYSMAGDTEGGIWLADTANETTWKLAIGAVPQKSPVYYRVVANDREGGLLLAGKRSIERHYQGRITQIPLPLPADGKPADLIVFGLVDDGKVLWMSSDKTGLMGLVDGKWQPRSAFSLPPRIFLGIAGIRPGQRWHATGDGTLVFNDNGKLTSYDAQLIGLATMLYAGEQLMVGGDQGLAFLDGDQLRKLTALRPEELHNISGMAVSADGDRWLNGAKGVVHVRHADWQAAIAHPDRPLNYELLGEVDGYSGQAMLENRLPSVYTDRTGQIWFMTSSGVVRLAPAAVRRDRIAPLPQVLGIDIGEHGYQAVNGLRLPPGSQHFNLRYTAPGLGKPDGMRFQYQLSGVDTDWQEAGGRRIAYYTNVAPGSYTFRVRAFNADGRAAAKDAQLEFEIEATFVQTVWFKALCALAAAALLYLLYWYRLRIATRRVAEQLVVRMAERERIARALHDTFLQSVQALTLRLDLVAHQLPEAARRQLEPIMEQADATIIEGRDQVHELRTGRVDDVETAAAEAGRHLAATHPGTAFGVVVSGTRRKLRDLAAEEACEIAREALRNAYHHAQASRVEARVSYGGEQFVLEITDDGQGMAPDAAAPDKHYGLVGMRERAARAGGRLDIAAASGSGVRVTLTLPARAAYTGRRWWQRRQP
ncbi:hypothetical protein GJ699_06740 [Duganella sp. FT80W]|uniref:Histidine kinase domain-containing protein n=1 Tax=Duganella guangzhouensis TaxID=2666084 RepID=A0A6I2KUK8_9BURK|nr:sensor histidine kinase [Duganella guangzhouensis]MRW89675.1 hypothetical protein [Duganella guangzhouensis]